MESRARNSLAVGERFKQDLIDSDGNVALAAGEEVTAAFLKSLATRGCQKVFFRKPDATLMAPYDKGCLNSLRNFLEDAPALIEDLVNCIRMNEPVEFGDINASVDNAIDIVQKDPAAVLSATIQSALTEYGSSPSSRSIRLSTLAIVAAELMGMNEEECRTVGRAGMLHDISLKNGIPDFAQLEEDSPMYDEIVQSYREHPLNSAQMIRDAAPTIDELELVLITQVHEQCDGSGFPKGLKKHHLHPLSRLLNVVDAFLSLTDVRHTGGAFVPADALAYLVLHTLYGSFDRECLQALIRAAAVYPVGTEVRLSDDSRATVFRSTGDDYMKPIVQIHAGEAPKYLDLRHTDLHILEPAEMTGLMRLPKSMINSNLWSRVN